jgi:putative Holliday junction resolvase
MHYTAAQPEGKINRVPSGALLGLDFGGRNIGVAVCDGGQSVCTPLEVIRVTKDQQEIARIADLASKWQVTGVVIGTGTNNESTAEHSSGIKRFAARIKHHTNLPIFWQDELLSSRLSNQGLSAKLKSTMGDAYAASHILGSFLSARIESL